MDDQLHRAGFIEEAFHAQRALRGQEAERDLRFTQVFGQFACGAFIQPRLAAQPSSRCFDAAFVQRAGHRFAQPRNTEGKLLAAPRRLADPERNRRRRALRILHAQLAGGFDLQDAIRGIAQLEHIARKAFDREILVYGADDETLRFKDHLIVGGIGDRAAGTDGREPRAAPCAQGVFDAIPMQVCAACAYARGVALGQHLQHRIELLALQIAVRHRAAEVVEQLGFDPFPCSHFGDDLLAEHIQRLRRQDQRVEFTARHAMQQRCAFHQFIARSRKQAALWRCANRVARAAHPLQKGGDRARRTDLAHQIHIANVDAQFQRCRGYQRAQLAALQFLFGIKTQFLCQTAVMRGDGFLAEPQRQMPHGTLGHAAGVDEDQRGAVFVRKLRKAVENGFPGFVRHHRRQRDRRQFQGQIAVSNVAGVDDRARARIPTGLCVTAEEISHGLDGFLRGGKADALEGFFAQRFQPFQGQHQMAAALARVERVDFIDDHAAHVAQHRPARFGTEQHVKRFGRGDEDVRRQPALRGAFGLRRIAGANGGANLHRRLAEQEQFFGDAGERRFEVDGDVVGQRFQRRDVNHLHGIRQTTTLAALHQIVQSGKKAGECLARTRGRCNQCVLPARDDRPRCGLRRRRCGEVAREPVSDRGVEGLRQRFLTHHALRARFLSVASRDVDSRDAGEGRVVAAFGRGRVPGVHRGSVLLPRERRDNNGCHGSSVAA